MFTPNRIRHELTGIAVFLTFLTLTANSEEIIWLQGSFKEINCASPMIGAATVPMALTQAIVAAVPASYINDVKEDGIDIPLITTLVEAMPPGEKFELKQDDFHLRIVKFKKNVLPDSVATKLSIKTKELSIPAIPLFLSKPAVGALKLAMKALSVKIDDPEVFGEALNKVVDEVKKTPPGILLKGEDKLMDSWLEIRLE